MKGEYITKVIQARISQRITLWVFGSLLLIETVIFLPSYLKREQDLLASQEQIVTNALETALSTAEQDASPVNKRQVLRSALEHLEAQEILIGYVLTESSNTQSQREDISPILTAGSSGLEEPLGCKANAPAYEKDLKISRLNDTFSISLCYNARYIRSELNSYTIRIIGLILLIALVVTLGTMLSVERLVIRPVLKLREGLLAAGESLQANEKDNVVLQQIPERKDELGDVVEAFRQLYGQIWQAIEARDHSEQKEKERADQLGTTLSQLYQTQTQLLQSEKMAGLGQLVAGIAHEINNPISFIHGNLNPIACYSQDLLTVLQLYQQHSQETHSEIEDALESLDIDYVQEDLPRLLASMASGSERIRNIVRSLRTFSRLDETGLKLADLHEGLESTLMLLQHRLNASEKKPILVVKDYADIPLVSCYADLINQVFLNILTNAIEALESQTKEQSQQSVESRLIVIRTSTVNNMTANGQTDKQLDAQAAQQWVTIEIENNGPAISDDVLPKIYEPFFTTKPVGEGVGMSLAICYQVIVDRHKGKLTCFSSKQRTTFTIQLPVQQTAE